MAPSFALPKSLKRSRRSGVPIGGALEPVSSPERRPYGTGHLFIAPRIDLHTPGGRYRQKAQSSPFTPRVDNSPGGLVQLERQISPARPQRDYRPAQWRTWTTLVIPRLIPVWLELVRVSGGLKTIARDPVVCDCLPTVRKLEVTLISLEGISVVTVCCCRAPQSLLQIGYLVSAPVRPTYAFDIHMLDFIRLLHQRTAPNKSAWSASLEVFLRSRGYTIKGKDVIRRKLATSLKWFIYLLAEVGCTIRKAITNPVLAALEDDGDEFWQDIDHGGGSGGLEYLASRCPLCFGGVGAIGKLLCEFIVCIDACFTQKRRSPVRGKGTDPPLKYRPSVFLSPSEITRAENLVNEARPSQPATRMETTVDVDVVEEGMKVPKSVLDGCLDSFTAADEKRTKASTKYFADTGLMAMLCRHDQVLWLANMTTAGERQYYAIALIIKLFEHLPDNTRVGILYDIGCQLERSILKWGFIPHLKDRIYWAVSVFHAYGHQWPCQVVYHPRKREGFGLSDGEGCERLWSSLEFLIPTLRVSGFHQRLFSLDFQIAHEREQARRTLGEWLLRKFKASQKKRGEALVALADLSHDDETLKAEWAKQVEVQTRPLTRATGGLANTTIKAILSLMEVSSSLGKEISNVAKKLSQNLSAEQLEELVETRRSLSEEKRLVDSRLNSKRGSLGVGERQDLRALINDKYLQTRAKAFAVKERLRAKVQGRKFEFQRVDRAYSNTASESRLHNHVRSQIARHQPNISNLLKKYNELCAELRALINEGRATVGAQPPRKLETNEVYLLDVDAPIWDDRGLNDGDPGPVPLWLGSDEVREGITAWLTVQRCDEESKRLRIECGNLRSWASKELDMVRNALGVILDPGLVYQLELRKEELRSLVTSWRRSVTVISPATASASWSLDPSTPDGIDEREEEGRQREEDGIDGLGEEGSQHVEDGSAAGSSDWDSEDVELEAEDRVLQEMELLNLPLGGEGSDADHHDSSDEDGGVMDSGRSDTGSPNKRRRLLDTL